VIIAPSWTTADTRRRQGSHRSRCSSKTARSFAEQSPEANRATASSSRQAGGSALATAILPPNTIVTRPSLFVRPFRNACVFGPEEAFRRFSMPVFRYVVPLVGLFLASCGDEAPGASHGAAPAPTEIGHAPPSAPSATVAPQPPTPPAPHASGA